jgi:hypothetical protein
LAAQLVALTAAPVMVLPPAAVMVSDAMARVSKNLIVPPWGNDAGRSTVRAANVPAGLIAVNAWLFRMATVCPVAGPRNR